MNVTSSRKKEWILSQEAFDRLLAQLDLDRDRAGEKYENIRRKLVKFFEWRGCPSPEDHTDETINRVSRKLSEGEIVQDVTSYAYGVARLLFLEIIKERSRQQSALEKLPLTKADPEEQKEMHSRLECFETCMKKLPKDSRELILKYYQGEKHAKIVNRKQMAQHLGIPLNALRIRAHRIREKIEQCVSVCLQQ